MSFVRFGRHTGSHAVSNATNAIASQRYKTSHNRHKRRQHEGNKGDISAAGGVLTHRLAWLFTRIRKCA